MKEVKQEVKEVEKKVERVREEVKEVREEVERVREEVKEVDKKVEKVKSQVAKFEDQVNTRFDNLSGIQLNSMRTWLEDPIQPILAPLRVGDEQRYTAAKGFPKTVRDFWALASDPSALAHLARHYSISGWERWKRHGSDDTDATEYDSLEYAVTAHRDKCLRMLASTWGLHYSQLERPEHPTVPLGYQQMFAPRGGSAGCSTGWAGSSVG